MYTRPATLLVKEVESPKSGQGWARLDDRSVYAVKMMLGDHAQPLDLGVFRVVPRHAGDARKIFIDGAYRKRQRLCVIDTYDL